MRTCIKYFKDCPLSFVYFRIRAHLFGGADAKKSKASRSSVTKEPTAALILSEPEIEIWKDPEWEPALSALEGWKEGPEYIGRSDPKPLAKLLCSGKPVPEEVAKQIGLWLDPPWGNKGPRLTANLPKKYYPGTNSIKALIATKRKIEEALKLNGKVEAAVQQVMTETGLSRSYVWKARKLREKKIVIQTSKFF